MLMYEKGTQVHATTVFFVKSGALYTDEAKEVLAKKEDAIKAIQSGRVLVNDGTNLVVPTLVNAADYGVPQDRNRVIIVGIRKELGIKYSFPKPLESKITLKEVLKDVPAPEKDEICMAPYSSRYMSRNRKRNWNEQSFTIPAMAKQVTLYPGSPDMVKVGTDLWRFGDGGETRRLSYREAAAIQTFPKDMEFKGDLTSKYKQIGNAVPVKLAEVVAKSLYPILENNYA